MTVGTICSDQHEKMGLKKAKVVLGKNKDWWKHLCFDTPFIWRDYILQDKAMVLSSKVATEPLVTSVSFNFMKVN